jgi:prepilin-type N-terminal cleavage/methylation domain-containing protein
VRGLADTDGFTLVELLLTVALVSLVITGGFRLYYFADRSFVSGTLTADVQTDVQIAIRRITEELSLAHFVEFGRLPESSLDADDHFIYVN